MTPGGQFRPPPSDPIPAPEEDDPEEDDIEASLIAPELAVPELAPLLLPPVDDPLAVASEPLLPLAPESSPVAPELPVPEPLPDPLEDPLEEELEPPAGAFVLLPQPDSTTKPTRQLPHLATKRLFIRAPRGSSPRDTEAWSALFFSSASHVVHFSRPSKRGATSKYGPPKVRRA
jgi:hypothetical protein